MRTLRLILDPAKLDAPEALESISRAASILRSGGLVAFPTETVYGLGANALDPAAVARIFAAKQRPSWDPIIVHIAGPVTDNPMLAALVTEIPAAARQLMSAFWPGPLTLLLPRSAAVPDSVTAGRPLVGVRMPSHSVAFRLIRQAGIPIAAPSANLFSRISPTTARHVLADLDGRIDAVLDAGPARHGVESTVLDPTQSPMLVYRPGAVTLDQIRDIAGPVELFQPRQQSLPPGQRRESLPSPGAGLRHYAPRARLILVGGAAERLPSLLAETARSLTGDRVGLMLPTGWAVDPPPGTMIFEWGNWNAPEELAANLYAGLHALDAARCDAIVCPVPSPEGIGAAIRDRLIKAAQPS